MIKLFEKYNDVKEVKELLLLKAIDTCDISAIDFFVKKGYKADNNDIFEKAIDDDDVLIYFLKQGIAPFYDSYNYHLISSLQNENTQKILIDFNYAKLINDKIGFNHNLITKEEVEEVGIDGVKDFVNMKYDMKKFNI